MFRRFPSNHQGACYMAQRKNNVYIFQDTVIYISAVQFQFTTQSNVKQQNIFNILFIILTRGKFKLKNTNANNNILENIHIVLLHCTMKEAPWWWLRNSRNMSAR